MKTVLLEPEDAKLNMTPMIDMTFLLVVFFMLTIDLSQKEFFPVSLPFARKGKEDKAVDEEFKRFIVNLTREGKVLFKGEEYNLSSEDRIVQSRAIDSLQAHLKNIITQHGAAAYEPDGACKVPVLVHADWGTKWKYVQWVMQAAAKLKIYRIQFSVKRPTEDKAAAGGGD